MGHNQHDATVRSQQREPVHESRYCRFVESRKRFVEQNQPRRVQQRTLKRQPLSHPSGEPLDHIVGTIAERRRLQRRLDPGVDLIESVHPSKERQILTRGEFRIELQLVRQESYLGPEPRTCPASGPLAVTHLARRRFGQRAEHAQESGLSGTIGAHEPNDLTATAAERHVPKRPPPTIGPGHSAGNYLVEIEMRRTGHESSSPAAKTRDRAPAPCRGPAARAPAGRRVPPVACRTWSDGSCPRDAGAPPSPVR